MELASTTQQKRTQLKTTFVSASNTFVLVAEFGKIIFFLCQLQEKLLSLKQKFSLYIYIFFYICLIYKKIQQKVKPQSKFNH